MMRLHEIAGSPSLQTVGQREDAVLYHGTNIAFDAFTPYAGALGTGVYITAYPGVAADYAKRRAAQSGGEARVIAVTLNGRILWNGTAAHQAAIDSAAAAVRKAERAGTAVMFNDAVRGIAQGLGYAGIGSPENVLIFDARDLRRVENQSLGRPTNPKIP